VLALWNNPADTSSKKQHPLEKKEPSILVSNSLLSVPARLVKRREDGMYI